MSVINAVPLLAAAGGDYTISRSVRLRSSASAYFNRTFTTPTDNKKWTMSMWLKRGSLGGSINIFGSVTTGGYFEFRFNTSDQIYIQNRVSSTNLLVANTTAVYRDPSAWYHIVFAFDSANATAANRNLLYVNGVNVALSANSGSGDACAFNSSGNTQYIGNSDTYTTFDGYMTEVNFIDGQALTPSSFGETDSVTGVWKPKKYAGTYGTNGFYLNFSDNSNNTAATIGKDYSGNGNNWTPNNISVTSGVTYDSMIDVPTMWADGGNGRGNYCVLNPLLYMGSGSTKSNGNLRFAGGGTGGPPYNYSIYGTFVVNAGKWYWETTITTAGSQPFVGMFNTAINFNGGSLQSSAGPVLYGYDGKYYNETTGVTFGNTYTTGDVIGIAVDFDNNLIWFSKNGTWQNSGDPSTGTNGKSFGSGKTWAVGYVESGSSTSASTFDLTFGQRPFSQTVPTGFKALNTQNLPAPTISNGALYMAATLYTGNGTSQTVTNTVNGVSFTPDLVWNKGRSVAYSHSLVDVLRGNSNILFSNTTDAESNPGAQLDITTNGFISTYRVANLANNQNGATYVGWQWKAGGAGSTNSNGTAKSSSVTVDSSTDTVTWNSHGMSNGQKIGFFATTMPGGLSAGTLYYVRDAATNTFKVAASSGGAAIDITSNGTTVTAHTTLTSTVSANTTAGFSIVTYTGTGANATVEHGLGVAPSLVIVKNRNSAGFNWAVWHSSLPSGAYYLLLNTTAAQGSDATIWNSTAPTSSVFSIGTSPPMNTNGNTQVAYCFSAVKGYSAFGKYTGNGSSTDGPFVYLGFRPKFIMVKRTDSTSNWTIHDTSRDLYNVALNNVFANLSDAEAANANTQNDILSNGFKVRHTAGVYNANGGTYIYAAFAESPFRYALAR